LAAGVILAAVLTVLNLNATPKDDHGYNTGAVATASGASAVAPTAAVPTQTLAAAAQVTYAGKVNSGGATIAIAVTGGKVVAYVCDGRSAEAWLQGSAQNGQLVLTGAGNASLTGTYRDGVASGSVSATGKQFAFSVKSVKPPSGLYRAAANVRNAQVVGGWIVLEDGTQVGVLRVGNATQPAPTLNTDTNSFLLNDTPVTVGVVDGSGL
jgi:serine/threonine-protein kinase